MAQVMVDAGPMHAVAMRGFSGRCPIPRQIMANYDGAGPMTGLIARYAPAWNAPAAAGPVAALGSSIPTGQTHQRGFSHGCLDPAP